MKAVSGAEIHTEPLRPIIVYACGKPTTRWQMQQFSAACRYWASIVRPIVLGNLTLELKTGDSVDHLFSLLDAPSYVSPSFHACMGTGRGCIITATHQGTWSHAWIRLHSPRLPVAHRCVLDGVSISPQLAKTRRSAMLHARGMSGSRARFRTGPYASPRSRPPAYASSASQTLSRSWTRFMGSRSCCPPISISTTTVIHNSRPASGRDVARHAANGATLHTAAHTRPCCSSSQYCRLQQLRGPRLRSRNRGMEQDIGSALFPGATTHSLERRAHVIRISIQVFGGPDSAFRPTELRLEGALRSPRPLLRL